MIRDDLTFVLHRPSSAENIGAVARVLANFGLSRLSVVPPPSWTGVPRSGRGENAREDVLRRARAWSADGLGVELDPLLKGLQNRLVKGLCAHVATRLLNFINRVAFGLTMLNGFSDAQAGDHHIVHGKPPPTNLRQQPLADNPFDRLRKTQANMPLLF